MCKDPFCWGPQLVVASLFMFVYSSQVLFGFFVFCRLVDFQTEFDTPAEASLAGSIEMTFSIETSGRQNLQNRMKVSTTSRLAAWSDKMRGLEFRQGQSSMEVSNAPFWENVMVVSLMCSMISQFLMFHALFPLIRGWGTVLAQWYEYE